MKHRKPRHAKQQKVSRKPEPLPTNVKDLQAMVIALQYQVAQLTRMVFGRRSERVLPDDWAQGMLFGCIDPKDEPVHSRRGYMWVYISEYDDGVFDYTNSRKRDGPAAFRKE